MKNLHLDLVRVTEAGAIAAGEWVGRGNKESADKAATDAMRNRLNGIDFCAEIAIGEGEKDESYGLYEGERVGFYAHVVKGPIPPEQKPENFKFHDPSYSIAIDPIEGTTPTAKGGYEAMSVIAMAGKDCFYKTNTFYMEKFAVGPKVKKYIDNKLPYSNGFPLGLDLGVGEVAKGIATILEKPIDCVTACVIDRPRSEEDVKKLREVGCRIKFISDCDVTACIAACEEDSGIDFYWSIGGSPEAVIAAAAMKCMGGYLQCREWSKEKGSIGEVLTIEDLAKGETMFVGTGITNGKLLKGVRFAKSGPITHSIAMRSGSGTIRKIETKHGN